MCSHHLNRPPSGRTDCRYAQPVLDSQIREGGKAGVQADVLKRYPRWSSVHTIHNTLHRSGNKCTAVRVPLYLRISVSRYLDIYVSRLWILCGGGGPHQTLVSCQVPCHVTRPGWMDGWRQGRACFLFYVLRVCYFEIQFYFIFITSLSH